MKFLSQINVNTEYTLPFVDGNNGQVLTTDGQGAVYWGNVSAGSTSLDGLTDVEITSPQAGQILNYSVPLGGTVPVWRNITSPYATIASPAFTGIPTAPTAPTGTDSTQIATTAFVKAQGYLSSASSINDLSDVTISTVTTGQILQWSGTQWVNATLSTVDYVSKVQHLVKCGVAVAKGQAVYVTSADGTNMIVGLASNASEATSSKVIGLAVSTGAINDQIFVVTEGLIAGLNTSTATAGDPVWLGTGGNLIFGLLNKPVAPAHLVYLGVVTRVQQNNGEIFVNVQNGFELNELHDVLINGVSTGQLLRRDSDGLWKNWSPNFLTSYTETDTLQTVTTRGATTNLAISANGVTSPNLTSTALMIINADSSGSLQPDQGSPANKILSFRWQANEYGYIDTDGKVTLNGFKTPTGTSSQFLKANGTVDSNTYLTTTAAAGTYTTYDYVDDEISSVNTYVANNFVPKTRTLTINGTSYDLSANRSWTITTTDSTKVSKAGESHDTVEPNNLGAGDGGFYTVKNGFGPSGGNDALIHIPYSNSLWAHQLAFDWALGNDQDMWFRTKNNGTWQGWRKVWHDGNFTDNSTNWNTAYNDRITAAAVSGTGTKTLTLTQGDGGTVTATWTDYDTDNDAQTISYSSGTNELSISNGNSITLDGLATEDYVLSQGFTTFQPWNSGTGSINYTAGNVGVGTALPTKKLHVVSGDNEGIFMQGSTNGGHWFDFKSANSNHWSMGAQPGLMGWYNRTDSTYKVVISDGGNVGINTTNPGAKLHVVGNTYIQSGVLFVDTIAGYATNLVSIAANTNFTVPSGIITVAKDLGTNDYANVGQHNMQLRIRKSSLDGGCAPRSLELGVLDNGTGIIQANHCGIGYNTLSLNPVAGSVLINGQTAWHAGNDGAGSGLDADLLDGQHGSYYASASSLGSYLPLSGGTMTGDLTLKYSTADSSDYNGLMFAPYSDAAGLNDYIIKAASDRGVFGRKSFGWHVHTESAFGVYSNGWEKLFGVEGGTGNTQVFGSLTVNGSITESSSIRYKKDIVDIEHSSSKIELLRPVRYKKMKDESEEIGLIAEDVAELFPEVVKYDNEGRPDGVNYSRLSVILLKAVQELTERVNKLENK
jgi:hypothetical protein